MRIGILQTGRVNEKLVPVYGDYPGMFEELLRAANPSFTFEAWDVQEEPLPEDPRAADAWLITGSKHGVYDDLPWIAPLETFLRASREAAVPIVGVCFGHQLLAQAFGGRAEKSDRGWGCGVHRYRMLRRPGWMADAPEETAFHAMHQDQVTVPPEGATLLAESEFCPFAMLAYGDPERPWAISIQPHPEFGEGYARDLVEIRMAELIPDEVSRPALESFGAPVQNADFARWTSNYLDRLRRAEAA